MANPLDNPLAPIITNAGNAAIIESLQEGGTINITQVALGDGKDSGDGKGNDGYVASESISELAGEKQRMAVTDITVLEHDQLRITAIFSGEEEYWVREVGFYLDDNQTLFAIYVSEPGTALAYKSKDFDLSIEFDLSLGVMSTETVTVEGKPEFKLTLNSYSLNGVDKDGQPGPEHAIYVDQDGKTGIGTTAPAAGLDVVGTVHGTEKATVDGQLLVKGRLGVGTDDPQAPLQVAGFLQAESLSVTSDATFSGDLDIQGTDDEGADAKTIISGNLTVEQTVVSVNTLSESDVRFGNEDGDIVRIAGVIRSGSSDAPVQINAPVQTAGALVAGGAITADTLDVKEDIRTEGAILAGSATIEGGLVARQRMQVEGGYRYNPMKNHMYPPTLLGDDSPLVYQDIFDAKEAGVIGKLGDPAYDDTTHNNQDNAYHGRRAICYGTGDNNIADFTGARVNVPAGYDTLWVRVLSAQEDTSPQWTRFQACSLTAEGLKDQDYGIWVGGGRFNNRYCPDGSLADGGARYHEWLGIPVEPGKDVALLEHPGDEDGLWFSGLAFSKNPWHHTTQAANVYKNAYNGGEEITWVDQSWNHDILAKIPSGKTTTISVPVLPSGTDKLIYLIERNDNSNGAMHAGITITVEGEERKIERFSAGYQNPFARHWNSKWYQRYMAARIPKEFIPSDKRYIDVTIDMGYQTDPIYLREIGTHDLETPFLE